MNLTLSPQEYAMAFAAICETSRHHLLARQVVQEHVVPHLPERPALLDVGSGAGVVAREISQYFASITLIEPSAEQLRGLVIEGAEVFPGTLEAFAGEQLYDLVLCSHVLYHVAETDWPRFIDKLLALTRPGGYCLIALIAPRGQNHELHQAFNPAYVNSARVLESLRQEGREFVVYEHVNSFEAATFEAMYALCRFFVLENCLSRERLDALTVDEAQELEQSIRLHTELCRVAGGTYRLVQDEDYVLIPRRAFG